MIVVYVDLEKAYDNVNTELMWSVLGKYEIQGKLARAVRTMYVNCEARVKVLYRRQIRLVHQGRAV